MCQCLHDSCTSLITQYTVKYSFTHLNVPQLKASTLFPPARVYVSFLLYTIFILILESQSYNIACVLVQQHCVEIAWLAENPPF